MTADALAPARLITVAPYSEATPSGAIFGGWIMSQLDHAAGLAGRTISGGPVVIASIRELNFLAALFAGEALSVHVKLTRKGSSSFNVAVNAIAKTAPEDRGIFTADVLLVAVDGDGKSRKFELSDDSV